MSYQLTQTLRLVWNWGNFVHEDTQPRLLDVSKGEILATLIGHTDYIRGASMFGSDRIVTWSNDRSIRVWALDGRCLHTFIGHKEYIRSVFAVGDDRLASTCGADRLILWSLRDGTSTAIDHLGKDLWLLLSREIRVLVSTGQGTFHIVDTVSGESIAIEKPRTSFLSTYDFDEISFLIVDDGRLERVRWQDGAVLNVAEVPRLFGEVWRCDDLVSLDGRKALVAGQVYSKPNRVAFHLFDMDSGALLAERDISASGVLWMIASPCGRSIIAQLKDYRCLTLDANTLTTIKTSGVQGYQADGFWCYAPEERSSDTAAVATRQALSVEWLDPDKSTYAVFDNEDDVVSMGASGALSDGSIAIAFETHWRVYTPDMQTFETLSHEAFSHFHPAHFDAVHWGQCKSGKLTALTREASKVWGFEAEQAERAVRQLENEINEPLFYAPAKDGLLLAYSPNTSSIWRLNEAGTGLSLTLENEPDAFVGHEILCDRTGQIVRLSDEGLRPVQTKGNLPLNLHRDAFSVSWRVHLRSNGHLLILRGTGVTVIDSETGETLAVLESEHGMGMWGLLAGECLPITTWSRTSLRSWDAQSYTPIVEIKDPEDWGAGYEYLHRTSNGLIAFTAGDCSHDGRIMVWDGSHKLAVYHGHGSREVDQIKSLTPELFLSRGICQGGKRPVRLWHCPNNAFDR